MPPPAGRPRRASRARRSPAQKPLGRLHSYSVNDLFGIKDNNYSFNLNPKEPTLLTGVNGTGKSTILRSIDAISTSEWVRLLDIPFKSLTLTFDSGREINVERDSSETVINLTGEEGWRLEKGADLRDEYTYEMHRLDQELAALERYSLEANSINREEYVEQRTYLANRRNALLRNQRALQERFPDPPPTWTVHLSDVFPVLFITDQRLVVERDSGSGRVSTRADEAARQISREISNAKALYANRSQALDRDFPQRVVRAIADPPAVSDEELRHRLDELTRTREALESVGLLPVESASAFEGLDLAPAHVRAVISTYVDDTEKKLEALEPLRIKLQLFSEFLGQHYKKKQIHINPERGFIISVTGAPDRALPPGKLSSGEQQIMVLAHEILFRATPGTLVLIDEPELSLHVLWQASFVQDLAQMGKVNNLSYLLATHSPTLIGGREDLKRSLDTIGGV
jgi:predicted ATP-binding protein involved in virulence